MEVTIGNANAIEAYRDPQSSHPEKVQFRELEGERTTTIIIPEGISIDVAYTDVLGSLRYHMAKGSKPAWIESDNKTLRKRLLDHFGMKASESNRPEGWGEPGDEE